MRTVCWEFLASEGPRMRHRRLAAVAGMILAIGVATAGPAAASKSFSGNTCSLDPAGIAALAVFPCVRPPTKHSTVSGVTKTFYSARYGNPTIEAHNEQNFVGVEVIHITGGLRARAGREVLRQAVLKHVGTRVSIGGGGVGVVHDEFTASKFPGSEMTFMSSRGEGTFVRGNWAGTITYGSATPEPVKNQTEAEGTIAAIMRSIANQL